MKGFKDFLLRGNLVELAVAFIMAVAFTEVVTATVTVLMDLAGAVGGSPNFSSYQPGGIHLGDWLTAVISFVVLAAVVYFLIVLPYTRARDLMRRSDAEELPAAAPEDVALLTEIRDLLRAGRTP